MRKIRLIFNLLIGILLISCSSDNNEITVPTENQNLVGSKWTLTNWDYSLGEDYIGLHNETYDFFFYSLTDGVFYYGRKDNYSDQDASNQRIACHFKFVVNGNEILLNYITDKYLESNRLQLKEDILLADKLEFARNTISYTDKQWLNTIQGTSGSCTWYSDMNGKLWIIGEGAMADYTSYESTPWAKNGRTPNRVVVGEGVTTIGSYAFANLSITEVEMPDKSLKQVCDAAFKGSLIKTIWMSQNTTIIGKEAFANCTQLKDINIPQSITSIGEYAFSGCTALSEFKLEFGEHLKTIGLFAFEGGEASYLTFAEGIQSISTGAFIGDYCGISKELILPNSLTSIGSSVFEGVYKKIVIGTGVKDIGDKAFISGATSGEMYVNLSTPPSTGNDIVVNRNNWNPVESQWTLYVPVGCKAAYSSKSPWNRFKSIIEDGSLQNGNNNNENIEGGDNDDDVTEYSDLKQDELDANDYRRGEVANGFSGGTGTSSDPYIISSAAELRYFSDAVRGGNIFKNQHIRLDADITINRNVLTRYGELNGNGDDFEPWIPIGRYNPSYFFCGTFDGNGHTISGLYCNRPEGEGVGLFGKLFGNVKNVIIADSYFRGKDCVGGIAGTTQPNYIGTTIPTSIKEYYQKEKNISIVSCTNESMVKGEYYIGGIVGANTSSNTNSSISKCMNQGYIVGYGSVGGIVGKNGSGNIIACYNDGYVRGIYNGDTSIGGILGNSVLGSNIFNCLNSGDVKSVGNRVGGICGSMGNSNSCQISNCVNVSTNITSNNILGAILAYNNGITVTYNYYLFQDGLSAVGANHNGGKNYSNNSLTEDEFKNTEILDKLNSRVKTGWSKWKNGTDGFPILEWME